MYRNILVFRLVVVIFTMIFSVALISCGGGGSDGNSTDGTVTTVAPSTPQKIITIAADGQVTIKWDSVPNATSYNIYWNNTGGVSTSDTKITNVTSPYIHTGYTNDTMHYYTVTAVNSGGESPVSSEGAAISTLMSNIAFADTNLQSCIDAKGATWSFEIIDLDCNNKNISNLSGIENLTNLSGRLYLGDNNINNLSPLSTLTNLSYLYIYTNNISDVSPLTTLTNLYYLLLTNNTIRVRKS